MEVQNRWDKIIHDFGLQKIGVPLTAIFQYKGADQIVSWRTSCGCTGANKVNDSFHVSYTTKDLPEHLKTIGANEYQTQQTLYVNYANGETDQLHIKVRITK